MEDWGSIPGFVICRRTIDRVFRLVLEVIIKFSHFFPLISIDFEDFGIEFKDMNSSYIAGHKWLGIVQVFDYCSYFLFEIVQFNRKFN